MEPQGASRARLSQWNEADSKHVTSEDKTGTSTPSNEKGDEFWGDEEPTRTARYNYAHEKSLSHVDAKLFYQRHQLETQETEGLTSFRPSRAVTSSVNFDLDRLSRATSTASTSRQTEQAQVRKDYSGKSPRTFELFARDDPTSNLETSSSDPNNVGLHVSPLRQDTPGEASDLADFSLKYRTTGIEAEVAAVGVESSDIAPEMRSICTSIKRVQELRQKYIGLSLQGPEDNPKDGPGWVIYPPHPEPVWDDVKNRPRGVGSASNSLANSKVLGSDHSQSRSNFHNLSGSATTQQVPPSTARRPRKLGQDIGEDFELSDFFPLPGEDGKMTFKLDSGSIYQVYENLKAEQIDTPVYEIPTLRDFYMDLEYIIEISSDGPSKSFAFRALDILEGKYNLYFLVNTYEETAICKRVPHRDFYNVRKVDTHVHHSACMNQKHLLRFIKSRMKRSSDEIVMFRDGKYLTLAEVFESINLTAYDLSIDTLDMHVGRPIIALVFHLFLTFEVRRTRTLSTALTNSI